MAELGIVDRFLDAAYPFETTRIYDAAGKLPAAARSRATVSGFLRSSHYQQTVRLGRNRLNQKTTKRDHLI